MKKVFSCLGQDVRTELCHLEQSLACDGLMAVTAAFRIFLEQNYTFLVFLSSISTSSFVCPACSCFSSIDAGLL